jgi:hypothetical protein
MEGKVILYDANDVKIGETFARRAAQLVKQQRAFYTDESKKAVKFAPDVDDWEAALAEEKTDAPATKSDAWLIALAEKRIKERGRFILHTVLGAPTWFVIFLFCVNMHHGGLEVLMFFTGVFVAAYVIHLYRFITSHTFTSRNWKERRARKLAAELALLKAEFEV